MTLGNEISGDAAHNGDGGITILFQQLPEKLSASGILAWTGTRRVPHCVCDTVPNGCGWKSQDKRKIHS